MHTNFHSTWFFHDAQNGFAGNIYVILEVLHAVVLIFVRAVYSIAFFRLCGTRSCEDEEQGNTLF